jgi:hypothetical protein
VTDVRLPDEVGGGDRLVVRVNPEAADRDRVAPVSYRSPTV